MKLDSFNYKLLADSISNGYQSQSGKKLGKLTDGLVLGSGLGSFAETQLVDQVVFDFESLLKSAKGWENESHKGVILDGHAKKIVIGKLKDSNDSRLIIAQSGREHPYEGIDISRSVAWIRVMQILGVETLIGSNASGILTPNTLKPKDLMLIHSDQDLGNDNPLIGPNEGKLGGRFPHMGDHYPESSREIVKKVAEEKKIELKEGLYLRVPGPNYERREDVYRLRSLAKSIWNEGANEGDSRFIDSTSLSISEPTAVVGMSSTFEQIVAQQATQSERYPAFQKGRAYVSVATNYAAALGPKGEIIANPSHEEVQENSKEIQEKFALLVRGIIEKFRRI